MNKELLDAESKLEALQLLLDAEYPDMPCKSMVQEYYAQLDYVNQLKAK